MEIYNKEVILKHSYVHFIFLQIQISDKSSWDILSQFMHFCNEIYHFDKELLTVINIVKMHFI